MSRRRELDTHRVRLDEIREIMNSMKTLAYMETRKLARFLSAQQAVVTSLETMAADFLHHFPEAMPRSERYTQAYLLMGSERSFCGNFNERLLEQLDTGPDKGHQPLLLAMGQKLHSVMTSEGRECVALQGASAVEEVEVVLGRLVEAIAALQSQHGPLDLFVLYNGGEDGGSLSRQLLPPFRSAGGSAPPSAQPPLLNETPAEFLVGLTDQYLFAALNAMLYTSLMAENRMRVQHLEGAVHHLEDKVTELKGKSNALRQEEIIEEIEVILLSADLVGGPQVDRTG
jgi:F-type H+-transporting ATPase subunit gamma